MLLVAHVNGSFRQEINLKFILFLLRKGSKNTLYLLTEWEGRTGKYLARGPCVIFLVERGHARGSIASFRVHFQRANDLTQFIRYASEVY